MNNSGSINILECEKLAAKLAHGAGAIIKEYFGQKLGIEFKNNKEIDPVSEVDLKCQEFIASGIRKYYPTHQFIGEESDNSDINKLQEESKHVWVVDPLDGTLNFTSNFPLFSSSIALLYEGKPIVGAIHLPWPYKGDGIVIHASAGNGVYCDGQKIEDFLKHSPKPSFLSVIPEEKHSLHSGLTNLWQPQNRNTGSIAVDLALVGMKVVRYAVTSAPRIWDVAAGVIIVKESGGLVLQYIEPNKLSKIMLGKKMQLEKFVKFNPNKIEQKSYYESLKNWSGSLIFGDLGRD